MMYVLYGEDEARSRYKLETIKKKHTWDVMERLDLDTCSDEEAFAVLDSFSLFGDKTFVLIENARFLGRKEKAAQKEEKKAKEEGKSTRKKKGEKSPEEKRLEAYGRRDDPDKIIVFLVPSKTLHKAAKEFFPTATFLESKALDEKSVPGVLEEMARERGLQLDKPSMDWLAANIGTNTLQMASELDKLALFDSHPSLQDVKQLVIPEPSASVFAMTDALFARRGLDLLELYRFFRRQNMEPVMINGLLASQIRFVYQVRVLMDERCSQEEMARKLNVKPGRIYFAMKNARRFQADELLEHLSMLADLDYNLKSGKADKDEGFENFVLSLLMHKKDPLLP